MPNGEYKESELWEISCENNLDLVDFSDDKAERKRGNSWMMLPKEGEMRIRSGKELARCVKCGNTESAG